MKTKLFLSRSSPPHEPWPLKPREVNKIENVSIRTLILEFVNIKGASHIREMYIEILKRRPSNNGITYLTLVFILLFWTNAVDHLNAPIYLLGFNALSTAISRASGPSSYLAMGNWINCCKRSRCLLLNLSIPWLT